jgi:predicted MFS family arabinose efflux permease
VDTSILRAPAVRALLTAEVVSTTGMQMTWVALPWFVLVTTGSATRMSVVMAAEAIGLAAVGFPSGRLLNRLGARRTMLLCDGLRGPLMLVIPLLHWADALSFGPLVAVAFALGSLSAPYFAANRMILPELLGEDETVVSQANALFQGATRITLLLGPVTAGVLIGFIGAPAVLVVDAATYVAAVLLVGLFVPATTPLDADGEERGVLAGLRWVAREPLIRTWRFCIIVGDVAWQAIFVAIPVLVVARYGSDPRVVGALFAAFGVGAVLGNTVAYRLVRRVEGLGLIARIALAQALPLWLLMFHLPAAGAVCVLFVSGFANGLINPSLHAIITLRIPPALRGTVMTSLMTLYALAMPIGILGAGPLLDAYGVDLVFGLAAAVQTVTMAGVAFAARRAQKPGPPSAPARSPSHTQRRKRPLEEVVRGCRAQRPRQRTSVPRRDHLARGQGRGHPRADALDWRDRSTGQRSLARLLADPAAARGR